MNKAMTLSKGAQFIMKRLNENGFSAYVVGGSVRDFLRGVPPSDYDMTTDASPEEMCSIFSDVKTVKTGLKHGTLTIIVDSLPYEVTTFRKDGDYTDNRHPDSVTFTKSLSADLARRDFTMNAIAYSSDTGFVDLYLGAEDIKAGLVRAVGDAEVRFSEDALRILRGIRFASVLNYRVEKCTADATHKLSHLLKNVSAERIFTEWKKLISGDGAYEIITEYKDVISVFIPEIAESLLPERDAFLALDAPLRELSLFFLLDDAKEKYTTAMKRLKSDTNRREFGALVLSGKDVSLSDTRDMGLALLRLGEDATRALIALKNAYFGGGENMWELFNALTSRESHVCYRLSELKINGEDLRALGYSGKQIGRALDFALTSTATGAVENEREALLSLVQGERESLF